MTGPPGEQALLEAARGVVGGTPTFATPPPGPLRLAETRRFDGSDSELPRDEVGQAG